ncbi:Major facilitator superfamily domain, general substrate transporter [Niveomyces insectorum RCEF 264]|uniref:Major facilitator superfamily domain, general substrate transporter n=1 Tax=Niveomyces insectorum RCEF 264 TaxID=1081102 RepID=A0A167T7Y3_9HYPO|nr:Major facilitator superfamily domain, general substrate transporter [Niveomyces insectorum RCEF 264]
MADTKVDVMAPRDSMDKKSLDKAVSTAVVRGLPPLLQNLSDEEYQKLERRLVRKIDMRLLPPLIIIYIMNYLDRNAIGSARLGGMEKDLGLVGSQYQTCVSILFVGYMLMQVPSNMFLNKIGRPRIYLPTCMALWGVLCACSGVSKSYGGLLATRFLLGFVEAAKGAFATLSVWYARRELGLRTGIFYCGSMLSGAFSGLITAGINHGMNGARGLLPWRWIFIIEGSLTVALALLAILVLPDFPANTAWLTDQERQLAMYRLKLDAAGEEDWVSSSTQPMWEGLRLLMRDSKHWILFVIVYGSASAISINAFFPTVVASLGKSNTVTLLLTSPPYLFACIVCAGVSYHADRTQERFWHTVGPLAMSLVGFVVASAATGIGPRYFGAMIMLPGIYTSFNMAMVWTANTIHRPPSKRAAAVAFNNGMTTPASIYGSYLFPNNGAPRFVLAFSFYAGMAAMSIVGCVVLHFVLIRENRRLEQIEIEAQAAGREDPPNKGFRYYV